MTIWKAGMLAVCIHGGKYRNPTAFNHEKFPVEGEIYRVRGLETSGSMVGMALFLNLDGGPLNRDGTRWWGAERFRPAVQDWQSEKQSRTSKLDDMLKGHVPV